MNSEQIDWKALILETLPIEMIVKFDVKRGRNEFTQTFVKFKYDDFKFRLTHMLS